MGTGLVWKGGKCHQPTVAQPTEKEESKRQRRAAHRGGGAAPRLYGAVGLLCGPQPSAKLPDAALKPRPPGSLMWRPERSPVRPGRTGPAPNPQRPAAAVS